uniref:Alternative protein FXYD6P1 n=1 Tax=Homo sapiens TaxID=9606 RepID=L8E6T7_HUMAN|nr:alternative protein FXYD6P1 [Homo sapiens]
MCCGPLLHWDPPYPRLQMQVQFQSEAQDPRRGGSPGGEPHHCKCNKAPESREL